jgi:predicted Zn-dependent protease
MSRIVRSGSSAGAIEVTLDEDHNHIHARLLSAMDMFIIAHEEAHVILGHISNESVAFRLAGGHAQNKHASPRESESQKTHANAKSQRSNKQAEGTSTPLKAQLRTREQELEADALGFKLMMWSEENGNDPIAQMMAAAAPHMVFRIMDAADAYGREAGGWGFSDVNHPPAADRVKSLSSVFDKLAKESELLREVDFRILFDAAWKVLLAEADPQIRQNLGLSAKPSSRHAR